MFQANSSDMTALSLSIGTQELHHHHNIPNTTQSPKFSVNLNIGSSLSLPHGNANEVTVNKNAVNVNVTAGASESDASTNHQFGHGLLGAANGQRESGYGRRAGGRPRKNPDFERDRLRMIKNRESAARSRARKQAQEVQQQNEIINLKKENEFLKGVTRFLLAARRMRSFKTPTLLRSFSAPMLFNRSNF